MTKETRDASGLIGYVADDSFLYDKLSGRELLEFVGEIRGMGKKTVADRIEREIVHFELSAFVDSLIETYSHGMKQRLALASALLHDPKVLVVDEPLLGLDPRSVRFVKDLLRAQTKNGATVFSLDAHTQRGRRSGRFLGHHSPRSPPVPRQHSRLAGTRHQGRGSVGKPVPAVD